MKYLIFILIFLTISCTKQKSILICGDHKCINKKEAKQYFEDNLTIEVQIIEKNKKSNFDLVALNIEGEKPDIKVFKSENKKVLKEARSEREALLKEARINGADIVAQAKAEAKAEADKIIAQAQESIQNEKRNALNELKNHVAQISLDIAEKVIDSELDSKEKQSKLVNQLISDASL